ncbi:MAG: diguanylate cyclase [Acidobacteria bacterium]|nr:MAG: diguanylate cyclase [Acidobacteriota bacterium]
MRARDLRGLVLASVLLLRAAPARAHEPDRPGAPMVLAQPKDHAPFAFLDESGRLRGIVVDLWSLWSRKTGVPILLEPCAAPAALERLARREADVVAAAVETAALAEDWDLSAPLLQTDVHVFALADPRGPRKLAELSRPAIGILRDDAAMDVLPARLPGASLRSFAATDDLFSAVGVGHVQMFAADDATAAWQLSRRGVLGRYRPLEPPLHSARWRAIFRKGDAALRAQVDAGFARITEAERSELLRKWMIPPRRLPAWVRKALWPGLLGLGAAALLVHWALLGREVRRRTTALRESERRARTLMDNLPGMAYRCANDREWTVEFVSDGCRAVTGWEPSDLTGSRTVAYGSLIREEDRESVWRDVQAAVDARRAFELVYRIRTRSGRERWVWERGCGVFGQDGALVALEGFVSDVTERQRAEEELRGTNRELLDQAFHDPLTGLPNRRAFVERLEAALARCGRERRRAALLYVDLDGFKEVNDRFGHAVGDQVLAAAARRLREAVRRADDVSRLGGDEFAVVVDGLAAHRDAELVARQVVESLSGPFAVAGVEVWVGASVGIAVAPDDGTTVEDLTARADRAMYAAKAGGKGRWAYAAQT